MSKKVQVGDYFEAPDYHPFLSFRAVGETVEGVDLTNGALVSFIQENIDVVTLAQAMNYLFCGPSLMFVDPEKRWWDVATKYLYGACRLELEAVSNKKDI